LPALEREVIRGRRLYAVGCVVLLGVALMLGVLDETGKAIVFGLGVPVAIIALLDTSREMKKCYAGSRDSLRRIAIYHAGRRIGMATASRLATAACVAEDPERPAVIGCSRCNVCG
jgi:hypothetical protein